LENIALFNRGNLLAYHKLLSAHAQLAKGLEHFSRENSSENFAPLHLRASRCRRGKHKHDFT